MPQSVLIHARVTPDLKKNAETILNGLGLSMTEAIRLYLTRIVVENGIPFELKLPNTTTIQAIQDARANRNIQVLHHASDLLNDLDDKDINARDRLSDKINLKKTCV